MEWSEGKLTKARILSVRDRNCVILTKSNQTYCIRDSWGNVLDYRMEGNKLIFHMIRDRMYFVTVE